MFAQFQSLLGRSHRDASWENEGWRQNTWISIFGRVFLVNWQDCILNAGAKKFECLGEWHESEVPGKHSWLAKFDFRKKYVCVCVCVCVRACVCVCARVCAGGEAIKVTKNYFLYKYFFEDLQHYSTKSLAQCFFVNFANFEESFFPEYLQVTTSYMTLGFFTFCW